MKQSSKLLVVVSCVIALLLAAAPAFARHGADDTRQHDRSAQIKDGSRTPHDLRAVKPIRPPAPARGGDVEFTGTIDSMSGISPAFTLVTCSLNSATNSQAP
jgi:hypothetical protein